jgi:hypothetical protein
MDHIEEARGVVVHAKRELGKIVAADGKPEAFHELFCGESRSQEFRT